MYSARHRADRSAQASSKRPVSSASAKRSSVARAAVSIVALSTVAALYPAFTASRLEPWEALQRA